MRKIRIFLLVVMIASFCCRTQPAIQAVETKKIIFLCEKPEYASSEVFIKFVHSKKVFGNPVIIVNPELFNDPKKLRDYLGAQENLFLVYAIGNLQFAETAVVAEFPFPIPKIKWDAPYWWPNHDFIDRFYFRSVPKEPPTIVARIPVKEASELDSWLLITESDVVSRELKGLFASSNILNPQNSKLFPHFRYREVNDTYSYEDFKNFKILSEKRGKSRPGEQLTAASFKKAFSTSNLAVISSTADQVKEIYYRKEDILIPIAKTRDNLATSYLDRDTVVEQIFFSGEDIVGKNRLILLSNFYEDSADLKSIFDVSRCVLTNYPGGLFFHVLQEDRCRLHQEILKKFLSGKVLAGAIVEAVMESKTTTNEASFDFVVWGDPLITMDYLTRGDSTSIDIGLKRDFIYNYNGKFEIDFINLPDFLSFTREGEAYRFNCSIPPVAFFLFGDAIIEKFFLLEFQEKETGQKGWIFLKLKIFNFFGGIGKSPKS